MNNTPQNPSRREQWEERVTALLLGEVSGAEAREIERLMEGDAGLRSFHDRMKSAVGLVRKAVPAAAAVGVAEETGPRLSEERRRGLLEHFKKMPLQSEPPPPRWRFKVHWAIPVSLAATVVALLGWQLLHMGRPVEVAMYERVTALPGRAVPQVEMEQELESVSALAPVTATEEARLGKYYAVAGAGARPEGEHVSAQGVASDRKGDQPLQRGNASAGDGLVVAQRLQNAPSASLGRPQARTEVEWAKYPGGPGSGPAGVPGGASKVGAGSFKAPPSEGRSELFGRRLEEARVWDARTGQPLTEALKRNDWMQSAQFSPDGQTVVTAPGNEARKMPTLAASNRDRGGDLAVVPQLGDIPLAGKAFYAEEMRERIGDAYTKGRAAGVSESARALDDAGAARDKWGYGGYGGLAGGAGGVSGGGGAGGGFANAAMAGQADVTNGLTDVAAIASGASHSVALRADGTVLERGDKAAGQAGGRYDVNFFSGSTSARSVYWANAGGFVTAPQEAAPNLMLSTDAGSGDQGGQARSQVAAPSKPADALVVGDLSSVVSMNGVVMEPSTGLPAVRLYDGTTGSLMDKVAVKGVAANRGVASSTDELSKLKDLKLGVARNEVRGKEAVPSRTAGYPMSATDERVGGAVQVADAEQEVDMALAAKVASNVEAARPEPVERFRRAEALDQAGTKSMEKQAVEKLAQLGVELRLAAPAEGKPQDRAGLVEAEGKKLREVAAVQTDQAAFGLGVEIGGRDVLAKGEEVVQLAPAAPAPPAGAPVPAPVPSEPALATPPPAPTPPSEPKPEVLTAVNPISTFSLNVSDVSFKLAAASLGQGQLPAPASVRSEEFLNAFDYHDPAPAAGAKLALAWDQAQHPFAHNRDLLRFSIQTAAWGREVGRPLSLVLLVDNSGSMERADRVRILRAGLTVLARQLTRADRVSVVAFARTPWLCVDGMAGGNPDQLLGRVLDLNPEGGTNLEEALGLAYQTAAKHFIPTGNNRVILMTDGAANLGNVDPQALRKVVETHRQQGIALDCFGVGWEGYNDDLLEVLARNGDGRYGFLNNPQEAATEFAGQLAGALRVAAADVKAQVEFNPRRVVAYRQIGYEKHQLTAAQFRDNTVDAAEIGAAESGTALYSIEVNREGSGPLGVVRVRYKVPGTGLYEEQEWLLPYSAAVQPLDRAYPSLRLAGVAALFAEWLARSPHAGGVSLHALQSCLQGVPESFALDARPRQLQAMLGQARTITGR